MPTLTAPITSAPSAAPTSPVAPAEVTQTPAVAPTKAVKTRKVAAKTAVKTAAKAAAKVPVARKPAAKTAPVAAKKPAARKAAKAPVAVAVAPLTAKAPAKAKPKLVRDSFTMPKVEYAVIDELKQRAAKLGRPAKKSELLRAGVKALNAMGDDVLRAALSAVPTIKTGRPHKA